MRLKADLERWGTSFGAKLYHVLFNSNFQMIMWYRIAHFLGEHHLFPLAKIIMYFHKIIFSCDIDFRCEIGPGIKILHGLAIVIGKNTVIGKNCTIYQSVTFAGRDKSRIIHDRETNFPTIGDNVIVYTGSVLYGPIIVEDNAIIGANSFVDKDVQKSSVYHN